MIFTHHQWIKYFINQLFYRFFEWVIIMHQLSRTKITFLKILCLLLQIQKWQKWNTFNLLSLKTKRRRNKWGQDDINILCLELKNIFYIKLHKIDIKQRCIMNLYHSTVTKQKLEHLHAFDRCSTWFKNNYFLSSPPCNPLRLLPQIYSYMWVQGAAPPNSTEREAFCIRSTVRLSKALSPAFDLREYTSKDYSTWTESRWKSIKGRIFLVASHDLEVNPSDATHVMHIYGGLTHTCVVRISFGFFG